jgi:hypothetical protein
VYDQGTAVSDEVIAAANKSQSLLDPKVKKRLLLVFHAWSIQYAVCHYLCLPLMNSFWMVGLCGLITQDESRMRSVAQMYSQYSGAPSRRVSSAFHTL